MRIDDSIYDTERHSYLMQLVGILSVKKNRYISLHVEAHKNEGEKVVPYMEKGGHFLQLFALNRQRGQLLEA